MFLSEGSAHPRKLPRLLCSSHRTIVGVSPAKNYLWVPASLNCRPLAEQIFRASIREKTQWIRRKSVTSTPNATQCRRANAENSVHRFCSSRGGNAYVHGRLICLYQIENRRLKL